MAKYAGGLGLGLVFAGFLPMATLYMWATHSAGKAVLYFVVAFLAKGVIGLVSKTILVNVLVSKYERATGIPVTSPEYVPAYINNANMWRDGIVSIGVPLLVYALVA